MAYAILRTAKLKTWGNIAASLSHNYRTRETPNANPELTPHNYHSEKTPNDVAQKIMQRLPTNIRKNAVLAIEYLITASPEFDGFNDDTAKGERYFEDAIAWLKAKHGNDNVVATSIHIDEKTPHMIAYVVPLDDNGKLNCRHFLGGGAKLSAMQTDFAQNVGAKFGLERGIEGSKAEHKTISKYYAELNNAMPTGDDAVIDYPTAKNGNFLSKESDEEFADRVANTVLEVAKPQLDRVEFLERELDTVTKELKQTRQQLSRTLKEIEPYREAVKGLFDKEKFDNEMIKQGRLMFERQQTFWRQSYEEKQRERERDLQRRNDEIQAKRWAEQYKQRQEIENAQKQRKTLNTDVSDTVGYPSTSEQSETQQNASHTSENTSNLSNQQKSGSDDEKLSNQVKKTSPVTRRRP
jgi:hypothetical protein